MIQYVNILTKDGKSLLFRNYGTSEVDRDLLAGFLSVFSGFMKEISKSDIKSTQTEDFKYFYTIIDTVIIVVCTDLEDDDSSINSKILSLRTKFIEQYGAILKDGSWAGNRTLFYDFEKVLDNHILGAIKISILGFGGVGKTELIRLIVGKDVDLEYVPTITADIASYEGDEIERSITLWDFAGQNQFRSLWKSLLQGSDICLLVTDSTFSNINGTKEIIHDILDKHYKDKLVIGIANYQGKPNRLTPEFCERILSTEERKIKVHGIDTRYPMYREKILRILKDAIKEVSSGLRPSYKIKEKEITKKLPSQKVIIHRKSEKYSNIRKKIEKPIITEAYSFADRKDLAQFIGKNKQEVKAVEICYKYLPKFREDKITDQDVSGAILRRNLIVLTSKYKLLTIIAWIYVFGIGYLSWFGWFFIPSTMEIDLSSTFLFYSFEIPVVLGLVLIYSLISILDIIWVRLVAYAIYLKKYFIVLDSQGIYYRKIGKPRFLAWNNMYRIIAKKKTFRYKFQTLKTIVISVYPLSKRRVRFNCSNYHLKQKDTRMPGLINDLDYFANIFESFYYRKCPFFYN